jgi:biopolymer transport protein ExbD
MAVNKRKVPEFSASSMADIAFLLLIFFLVATTMNVDTGISRILPPMPPDEMPKEKDLDVKERNLLAVYVNQYNQISVSRQYVHVSQLKDRVKEFILNPTDDPNMPERKDEEFTLPDGSTWVYPVSEGIVSLNCHRGTSYETYIAVQNELTRVFNEIRDQVSIEKFGRKFLTLDTDDRAIVAKAVPQKISEAEPRNTTTGGK